MYSESDREFMLRALALAQRSAFHAAPNPRVGCVIVRDARVLGEGFTQPPGSNHAEVEAILDSRRNGHDVRGSTVYVSLEPCSHFGRTPPCATALSEAKVARVIAAVEDPNPAVSSRGLEMLRNGGVDVRCGLLEQEAAEVNAGFFSRMTRGRPWVRLKIAASLDGKTALANGVSQWITAEDARRDGHAWRARACAVLTGIGTVQADNPQLNVRLVETSRQPLRVVIDRHAETPPAARVLAQGHALVVTAGPRNDGWPTGVETLALPDPAGRIDLPALMRELARRGVNELHVEGGARLNGALIAAGLIDEVLHYVAPSVLGDPARGMFELAAPLSSLDERVALDWQSVDRVGTDLRLIARIRRS
jgi:diaminohydroxyphosphoribosylaminopyrimidine deaminase/5-amino-6-(5-phosphoribosylamino)uracil reductase